MFGVNSDISLQPYAAYPTCPISMYIMPHLLLFGQTRNAHSGRAVCIKNASLDNGIAELERKTGLSDYLGLKSVREHLENSYEAEARP